MEAVAGETARESSAGNTVKLMEPFTLPTFAVTENEPPRVLVDNIPPEVIVARVGSETVHVAVAVRSCVVPLL